MKRGMLSFLTVLSCVCMLDRPVAAADRATAAISTATSAALQAIHIDNFGRINDTYYRGAQPEGADYANLAAAGVKAIVDLTGDDSDRREPGLAKAAGLKFFKLPMNVHRAPTVAELASFLGFVNDPANQPVYVHCVGGKHRTGVMTAVYRMTADGWSADQAFREMKQFNFGADFLHPEFKQFVYSYHVPSAVAQAAPDSKVALIKTTN